LNWPRLRDLPAGARLGLTGLLVTLLMGMAASAMHIVWHYEKRDEKPGFTKDDVLSAYHGLKAPATLLAALSAGHPDNLKPDQRKVLTDWLSGTRVAEDYDSLDLGDMAPAEIIASSCISCHARKSTDQIASRLPLETWEDIKKVAFPTNIEPVPIKITAVSTHTHALALASMSLVLSLLAFMSRLPRAFVSFITLVAGIGLTVDIASWWLARLDPFFINTIIAGGGLYNLSTTLLAILLIIDLWFPKRSA
jgi:hypothetical protein